jgi:hypothetical protein
LFGILKQKFGKFRDCTVSVRTVFNPMFNTNLSLCCEVRNDDNMIRSLKWDLKTEPKVPTCYP